MRIAEAESNGGVQPLQSEKPPPFASAWDDEGATSNLLIQSAGRDDRTPPRRFGGAAGGR